MNLEIDRVRIPLWLIWLAAVSVAIVGVGYWYCAIDSTNAKILGLAGGILTGLIVYLLTFITLLRPIQEFDRFSKMGIRGLLANRHDQAYYRNLLSRSTLRVDVMGASCSRFVRDFLDVDSDDKVLIDALNKHLHLKVRLLIPEDSYMAEEARYRTKDTLRQISAAKARYGDRIEVRRSTDYARHSFVIADDDLVAGPVFDNSKSRHAPAVHVATGTPFGQKYVSHFDAIWDAARTDV